MFPTLSEAINGENASPCRSLLQQSGCCVGLVLLVLKALRRSGVAEIHTDKPPDSFMGRPRRRCRRRRFSRGSPGPFGRQAWLRTVRSSPPTMFRNLARRERASYDDGHRLLPAWSASWTQKRRYGATSSTSAIVLIFFGFAVKASKQNAQVLLRRANRRPSALPIRYDACRSDDDGQADDAAIGACSKAPAIAALYPAKWAWHKHETSRQRPRCHPPDVRRGPLLVLALPKRGPRRRAFRFS